jgi:signal transduction histidine kinase
MRTRSERPEPFNLRELLRELVALFRERLKATKCRISCDVRGSTVVTLNASCVQSIIVNLLRNAVDAVEASDKPRRITIIARCRAPDPKVVEIAVKDNGEGIAREDLERIFLPFFTTKGPRNMGVGLFLVQRMVKEMNGEISVDPKNSLGGATLTVRLPVSS